MVASRYAKAVGLLDNDARIDFSMADGNACLGRFAILTIYSSDHRSRRFTILQTVEKRYSTYYSSHPPSLSVYMYIAGALQSAHRERSIWWIFLVDTLFHDIVFQAC